MEGCLVFIWSRHGFSVWFLRIYLWAWLGWLGGLRVWAKASILYAFSYKGGYSSRLTEVSPILQNPRSGIA